MPYSQSEIDAAKLQMDNAYSALGNAKASMDSYYNWLSRCKYKDGVLELGSEAEITCQTKVNCDNDCCSKSTCESLVAQYNSYVLNWNTATDTYENAKDYYQTIKGEKKEGEVDTDVARLEQEAKAIRTRYYIFGGIVLVLIVAGIFIYMKYSKK